MQIAVIDLGIGNLRSVEQALKTVAVDVDVLVTNDPKMVAQADKVVLPGQGAIGTWFDALRAHQLQDAVMQAVEQKPLLGICVGMQAMFDYCAEDGGMPGLGLFQGSVQHFSQFHQPITSNTQQSKLKIPQMGWNRVQQTQPHVLWQGIDQDTYFYFVHSYCANLEAGADDNVIYGCADYAHRFIAAVGRDNVFAVQFHPEKSHQDGLQLLKNFSNWNGHP